MRITTLVAAVLILSLMAGCGENRDKQAMPGERVVAKINNYKLTASDFKDEARYIRRPGPRFSDPVKEKEYLLDEMITKKVLILEAQAQNFDKDRAFMKEIEKYWEQALLKLLYKKKSEEVARSISVLREEAAEEYRHLVENGSIDPALQPFDAVSADMVNEIRIKKTEAAFGAWIEELKSRANIKKYIENLKDVEL